MEIRCRQLLDRATAATSSPTPYTRRGGCRGVHQHAAADGDGVGEVGRGGASLGNRGQPGESRSCLALSSAFSIVRRSLSAVNASKRSSAFLISALDFPRFRGQLPEQECYRSPLPSGIWETSVYFCFLPGFGR